MSEEPPRKTFWDWMNSEDHRAVATIMACSVGMTICILAIFTGMALLQHKYDLNGNVSDMFKMVLSAMIGSLGTYIGLKKNGVPK